MRLTKTTRHAIRVLIVCAERSELIRVSEIAAAIDVSDLNAFKIVNLMSRAGLLQAIRGRNGGVRLVRPPERVLIGDVVRAMEQPDMEVSGQSASGPVRRRQINAMFDDALEAFIAVLNQHSLADLIAGRAGIAQRSLGGSPRRRRPGSRTTRMS